MKKISINKSQLGDLISLLLFDKMFDKTFVSQSENFNNLRNIMKKKGMKSNLFRLYFDINPILRGEYKGIKRALEKDKDIRIYIEDQGEIEIEEKKFDIYKNLVLESVKRVTGKENPNPEKIEQLTDELLQELVTSNKE